MGRSLDDMPNKKADRWIDTINNYFKNRELLYTIDVDRHDDATDDLALNLLKALADNSLTLDVYVSVKVWNAQVKEVLDGNNFGAPEVRFYEEWDDSNRWHTIAEFERGFSY